MADPVSNMEIEDVLSSIRRLVSDEARTPIRERAEPKIEADASSQVVELEDEYSNLGVPEIAEKAPSALLLTDALRVEEPPASELTSGAENSALKDEDAAQSEPLLILRNTALSESEQENDNPELSVSEDLDDTLEFVAPVDEPGLEIVDTPADEMAEGDLAKASDTSEENPSFEANDAFDQGDQPRSIEDKIAALEALINHSETDFEPDGAEDGANAARQGNALPWEDSFEASAENNEDISEETSETVQSGGFPNSDFPNPDAESQSVAFDDGAVAFQQAHSEAVETAQAELEQNAADTLLESDDFGAVLDEDALRDMVAEIVRQELQGPLGERITRNVRKLVRREIYRALASNELG